MIYEELPQRKKRRAPRPERQSAFRPPKQKKKRRGCLPGLFKLAFILVVLLSVFSLFSPKWVELNFMSGNRPDLSVNASLPKTFTNILLLGTDSDTTGNGRSDTVIIASIGGSGDIKLTSVMRDTMLDMGDYGKHKLNAAYKLGGGELSMYTINSAFGTNITKYLAIDFDGIAKVIDSIGGIELSITEAEMNQVNEGLSKAYKKKRVFNGVLMTPITEYGKNIHLSGTHALFYSRIRNIDSDYKRTERQRILLDQLIKSIRNLRDPIKLAKLAGSILSSTTTNLTPLDLGALGAVTIMGDGQMQQFRLPGNGAYKEKMDSGVWTIQPDLKKCQQQLYEFIYN